MERFSFARGGWATRLAGPGRIEVDDDRLRVQAWTFRLDAPRSDIAEVRRTEGPVPWWRRGIGAHGWRGRWLVNTSMENLVQLRFSTPQRASLLLVPIRVVTLEVNPDDPDGFIGALTR